MDMETSQILKMSMTHRFGQCVRPQNVLSLFQSMSNETAVLTSEDFSKIEAKTTSEGQIAGAHLLLDRLHIYDDWFNVLQKVLRHKDVKLSHVAAEFDKMKENAISRRLNQTVVHQSSNPGSSYIADSTANNPRFIHHSIDASCINTTDDFDLDDDYVRQDSATYVMTDTPSLVSDMPRPTDANVNESPKSFPATGDVQVVTSPVGQAPSAGPKEDDERSLEQRMEDLPVSQDPTKRLSQEFTDDEGYTQVKDPDSNVTRSDANSPTEEEEELYEVMDNIADASSGARPKSPASAKNSSQYANASVTGSEEKSQHRRSKRSLDETRSENNFTREETENGLSSFQGWHPNQNDKKVLTTFKRILAEKSDGYYLIWFWEKKKRPSICVSHKGKLVTFIIHRRRESNSTQYIYYIDKSQSQPTLKELFQYHLDKGLPDMKEQYSLPVEHIKLQSPIDPVTGPNLDQ